MQVKQNQNIFDICLQNFGTLENLFDDFLVPNKLDVDKDVKLQQEFVLDNEGKGEDDILIKIKEGGLTYTNGDIPTIRGDFNSSFNISFDNRK